MNPRLGLVLDDIDAANRADPHVVAHEGRRVPAEWLYGLRMSACLAWFCPQAGELVEIAARGQHVERWTSPRASYSEGRAGYLSWRRDLKAFHARRVGEIMSRRGYAPDEVAAVGAMLRKENLRGNADAQTIEDVACLVFLRHHLAEFMTSRRGGSLPEIMAKTWRKMSPDAQAAAATLPLPDGALDALRAGLAAA
jgi:Domain of unknown function (DUF4202)